MNYLNISKITIITTIFIIKSILCPDTMYLPNHPHTPSPIMRQRPEVPKTRPLTLVQRTEHLKQKIAHLKQNLMEIYLDMFNAIDEIFEINSSLITRLGKAEEKPPLHPPLKNTRNMLKAKHDLPPISDHKHDSPSNTHQ